MSEKVIDYFLSMNSPWSYMGARRLGAMARENGYVVNVYPTRFLELFEQTGGLPLAKRAPARKSYRLVEIERWAKFLKLPIVTEPAFFPADDTLAAHALIAAQVKGFDALSLSQELGRAQWELEQDFSKPEVVKVACSRAGIEMADLGDLDSFAEQFEANTSDAISRGVFGYPCYIADGEMFWGQDRLAFLERKISDPN